MNHLLETIYIDEQRMKQRLCEFNLKLSFLPPRVKLKQSCSNKVTQTRFILNEGYVKDIFQNKFKTRMLNYGDISH